MKNYYLYIRGNNYKE